ncbi:TlpA family protein disulfide reductase [Amycolatopsis cihanbeyliensis]|uniref:Thiol-disulfide isomerase/thioredoxin n=1 Tax=Amycolatopsis cihanbeyliensis TaxID=1128664 RepID=A0A542DKS2_AMYCI|nr:thioredoxin family protein [Amycolatopsis cihanbeyliensis]TQJ03525.1 thiol-disulfide isomerase/thioredoxin [Amycolatopsis cihanbeyliensis]
MIGLWVAIGTLLLGLAAGAALHARNGRVTAARQPERELPGPVAEALGAEDPVTLVQLSTTFCAPCRHARAVLSTLAERTEGLRHVDLDITQRPEVAQRLGVWRTPTTLALDPGGRELMRVHGVPRSADLLTALRPHLP